MGVLLAVAGANGGQPMPERNRRYDGTYVFTPDLTKIQRGDILLTRNREPSAIKGKALSELIATATGGSFSHALLCTDPPTFIEAIQGFVSNISVQNCFVHDLSNVRVLRYGDQEIAKAAASQVLTFLGQKYSIRGAILSLIPELALPESVSDQTFCSALVATAYRTAGAPEFVAIDPMKITPASLEKMPNFLDITTLVFDRKLAPQNIEEMSALDGDRIQTAFSGQGELLSKYYRMLVPSIDDLVSKFPSFLVRKPKTFFDCLPVVAEGFRACDALGESPIKNALRQQLQLIDDAAFELLKEGRLREIFEDGVKQDDKANVYIISESYKAVPDLDYDNLNGILAVTITQIASRSSILNSQLYTSGRSRACNEWLRFTRDTLEPFYRRKEIIEDVIKRVFPSRRS